ncbi:hypothetical protein Despr_0109 [Desulfobulbus propionicus DSM 2032]|uniref:Uncharacterized protein n=2 Tax=Desulfobulbus propionicus TaxID=894 RepID=A0A7U3YJ16_DESPD|nr:hypothetical protein Despr_0109 [Desulfobulbus propionicus DSM 2032]
MVRPIPELHPVWSAKTLRDTSPDGTKDRGLMNRRFLLLIVLLLLLASQSVLAQEPPQSLLDRQVRSVYYETDSYGSQPLRVTLGELIKHGLLPGDWDLVADTVWHYIVPTGDHGGRVRFEFTVITDPQWRHLFTNEVIVTGLQVGGRDLPRPEIWAVLLPLAVEVRARVRLPAESQASTLAWKAVLKP